MWNTLFLGQADCPFGHWEVVCSLLLFTWERFLAFIKVILFGPECIKCYTQTCLGFYLGVLNLLLYRVWGDFQQSILKSTLHPQNSPKWIVHLRKSLKVKSLWPQIRQWFLRYYTKNQSIQRKKKINWTSSKFKHLGLQRTSSKKGTDNEQNGRKTAIW